MFKLHFCILPIYFTGITYSKICMLFYCLFSLSIAITLDKLFTEIMLPMLKLHAYYELFLKKLQKQLTHSEFLLGEKKKKDDKEKMILVTN